MTTLSDISIPYSALSFGEGGQASAPAGITDPEVIASLLMRVLRRQADMSAGVGHVETVSVTIDVTGENLADGALSFTCEIDRQTRTLIFIGGAVTQGGKPCLKATAVYRIT